MTGPHIYDISMYKSHIHTMYISSYISYVCVYMVFRVITSHIHTGHMVFRVYVQGV